MSVLTQICSNINLTQIWYIMNEIPDDLTPIEYVDVSPEEMNIIFPPGWLNKPIDVDKIHKELEIYAKNNQLDTTS